MYHSQDEVLRKFNNVFVTIDTCQERRGPNTDLFWYVMFKALYFSVKSIYCDRWTDGQMDDPFIQLEG